MAKTEKAHICSFPGCKSAFSRPYRLKNHEYKHSGVKSPFICDVEGCDKSYTNTSHLRRHHKTAHMKITTIIACTHEGCHQQLSNLSNLNRHLKRAHTRKAHTCDVCKKGFKRKNELRTHSYEHTGIAPFSCAHCPSKFTAYCDYKIHQNNHKSYTCTCGETFYRWTIYLKHQKEKHPKEKHKEFKCEICNKVFHANRKYKVHLAIHNKDREVFECPFEKCERLYYYKKNLKVHMEVRHMKTKTFKKSPQKPKTKTVTTSKKVRKDKGTAKRSRAAYITGLQIPSAAEKAILSGIEVQAENVIDLIDSSDFSDSDYRIKKTRII